MKTLDNYTALEGGEATVFPASFGQKRLWPKNPRESEYNMPHVFRIGGPFNVDAFSRSVRELVKRHESLRTRFQAMDGEIRQIIETHAEAEVPVINLEDGPLGEREHVARGLIQKEINAPFDLHSLPLWRVKVLRLSAQDHIVTVVMNHMIVDGWSFGLIQRELSMLYSAFISGQSCPLPALPIQYKDFSEWEREAIRTKSIDKHLSYWKSHLSGTTALNLPYDHPKGTRSPVHAGTYVFSLERELVEKLTRLTVERKVSLHMILMAAYQILLHRYTGQQDILVACNAARRDRLSFESVVGLFAQPVLIRNRLSRELSFYRILEQVRDLTLAAHEHQDAPLSLIMEELAKDHDVQSHQVFQTILNYLANLPPQRLRLGAAVIECLDFDYTYKILGIDSLVTRKKDIISVSVQYAEMFNPKTITGMFQYYVVLLRNIADHPENTLDSLLLSTDISNSKHEV